MAVVITREALNAACETFALAGLGTTVNSVAHREAICRAIEAALPHLTDTGEPLAAPASGPTDYEVRRDAARLGLDLIIAYDGEHLDPGEAAHDLGAYVDALVPVLNPPAPE
jgi:hypothetical protein